MDRFGWVERALVDLDQVGEQVYHQVDLQQLNDVPEEKLVLVERAAYLESEPQGRQ